MPHSYDTPSLYRAARSISLRPTEELDELDHSILGIAKSIGTRRRPRRNGHVDALRFSAVLASTLCALASAVVATHVAAEDASVASIPLAAVDGRFGAGWNTGQGAVYAPVDARLAAAPLTVEMWVQIADSQQEHVFISHGVQTSADFWEIGARKGSGRLFARCRGAVATSLETQVALADEKWHYVALIWSPNRLKLFIDHAVVADVACEPSQAPSHPAGLAIGTRIDEKQLSQAVVDDVRLSTIARDIVAPPELPLTRDDATHALWDFEASREDYLARWTPGGDTNQRDLPYPHRMADFERETDDAWRDERWQQTDYGPFLSHSFLLPGREMGAKLTALFLHQNSIAVFDSQACSVTAVLGAAHVEINPLRFGLLQKPKLHGDLLAHVSPRKCWLRLSQGADGARSDRRVAADAPWEPFPLEELDYQGLRLRDNETLLTYRVGNCAIHEHNAAFPLEGAHSIGRRLELAPTNQPLLLTLAETRAAAMALSERQVVQHNEQQTTQWTLTPDSSPNVTLAVRGDDVALLVQASSEVTQCIVRMTVTMSGPGTKKGPKPQRVPSETAAGNTWTNSEKPLAESFVVPGDLRWGAPLTTRGKVADDDGQASYLLDDLTIPFDNPFNALFFVSGLDFYPNGDAALCTAHGDVWIVRGIDESLEALAWQRFATGLYQPLGLKIVDGRVVVVGRDQLTQLEDENGDGEADLYRSLCHDLNTQGQDHAFAMRLEADAQGNLYFLKSSEGPPHGCSLLRLPKGAKRLEVVASGFRHPYGLGIGPHDEITVADNEGNWVPSSKIDVIRQGGFYGYVERGPAPAGVRAEPPLCYLPKFIDNSCGGQTWNTSDRWGPYHRGEMLHLSWGRCTLHAVLRQQVGAVWQGATVRFPELVFRSGSGTSRFHPVDGQLYVAGLDGWQTAAVADGSLQRVRYTGRDVAMPAEFGAYANGMRIGYSTDLAFDELTPGAFAIEQWNYRRSETYGSFHYRPSQPDQIGHDALRIDRVTRLNERTVFLHIKGLQPVDQIQATAEVRTASGKTVRHQILGTIHCLAPALPCGQQTPAVDLLAPDNLVAWCVVPFDAKSRNAEQRAAMLAELGFKRLAYDWRDEHIPLWDDEVSALRARQIDLTAFWAPATGEQPLADPRWRKLFELVDRQRLHTQFWVMLDERLGEGRGEADRIAYAAETLRSLASEALQRGCQIGLYNHGGWFGDPRRLARIADALREAGYENVGVVLNFHHAHELIDGFAEIVAEVQPYLMCVNLNGMRRDGPKILPIGGGDCETSMFAALRDAQYDGPIGILDHREELDAKESLEQNLHGLQTLVPSILPDLP